MQKVGKRARGGLSLCRAAIGASAVGLLIGAGPSVSVAANLAAAEGRIVQTAEGPVRGLAMNDGDEFLGIPYAAPPVGNLRWRPPQPVKHWLAPLDATHYANTCPQVTEFGVFAGPPSVTEDCLYLNVFTTNLGHQSQDHTKLRPVIVWIHGGGDAAGESNDYDGSKLATGGPSGVPTVVVTFNYRLGLFGFLTHPALDSEGHPFSNYGILDQQAVLKWVQRNIKAFGGDPTNVTLAGESSGATDTSANLVSPLAAGLFQRAILESAPFDSAVHYGPLSAALAAGRQFAAAAGCPGDDATAAACLRALPTARILQLQGTPNASGPYLIRENVTVDGTVIPMLPATAFETGRFNKVPVMGGTQGDEGTFFNAVVEYSSLPPAPLTAPQYEALITPIAVVPPEKVPAVLAEYPAAKYHSPQLALDSVVTDRIFACEASDTLGRLAKHVPVYQYEFNYKGAPFYFPAMPGFVSLASHTLELPFLFPGFHGGILGVNSRPFNARERILSDAMVAAWTKFAQTGNPNGQADLPWPRFGNQYDTAGVLSFDLPNAGTLSGEKFRENHHCAFWDKLLGH
ncbi:carboxylesterase family protein [Trinickia symbiotica]|uniref:Carboxylic ester hydrolase n=2 Tax=Trinickia symbiotica TaxID=863227 RepID=A0A2N7WTW1_9BURK|nr:carboxylesterase family protein [Trinickia symbiotica]